MTIRYDALKAKVQRLLSDPDGATFSDELIADGTEAALVAVMPWVPRRAVVTIEYLSGSSNYKIYALPSDCYRVEGVYLSDTGEPLNPATLNPNLYRGESAQGNDWLEYPSGQLSFSQSLTENIDVFYLAYWPVPTTDASIIELPQQYFTGLVYYISAFCMVPSGIGTSAIRQWGLKSVDSGSPEDNPLMSRVKELLKLFELEMNRHPSYMKATRV